MIRRLRDLKYFGILAFSLLISVGLSLQSHMAVAAKKSAKNKAPAAPAADDPAVVLAKLDKTFDGILVKVRSRMLLTPKDAQAMAGAKLKLMDLMTSTPNNPALVLPVYKAGLLYAERDFPDDAIELFEFLQVHFPNHPYALRAGKQIEKLGGTPLPLPAPTAKPTPLPAATTTVPTPADNGETKETPAP